MKALRRLLAASLIGLMCSWPLAVARQKPSRQPAIEVDSDTQDIPEPKVR